MDPYLPLFSLIRAQSEHVKIAINCSLATTNFSEPEDEQRCIFAIVSNVERGSEECCILVCKRRRKDSNQARVIDGLAIGSDFRASIQQSQSSVAAGGSVLQFILTSRGKTVSGLSGDTQGIKDLIAVARDSAKTLSDQSNAPEHDWLQHYIEVPSSNGSGSKSLSNTGDVPIFSQYTSSPMTPSQSASDRPRPPSPNERELRVSIGTFNVNGQIPGEVDLSAWLHVIEDEPDILVVGLQEADSSNLSYVMWTPHVEDAWTTAVESSMGRKANEYLKLASKQLVGILLIIYIRKEIKDRVTALATSSVGVGFGGWGANKGATAVRFELDDELPVCFVVSHLSAFDNMEARERRRWDYNEIVKRLRFTLIEEEVVGEEEKEEEKGGEGGGEGETGPKEAVGGHPESDAEALLRATLKKEPLWAAEDRVDTSWTDDSRQIRRRQLAIMDHSVIFWTGDLNFRLELGVGEVKRLVQKRQFESALLKYDQLRGEIQTKASFEDFQEQKISFPPTYKYDRGTDQYDTSEKKRTPSWTDRVLWKQKGDYVQPVHYESCPAIQISDHKPVLATFILSIDKEK